MYSLGKDLTRDEYCNLINICFDYSDFFTLTIEMINGIEINYKLFELYKLLNADLLAINSTKSWHGYYIDEKFNQELIVFAFKSNIETKAKFISLIHDLYMKGSELQDICFFKDNTLFLGTISHACMCNFFPYNEKLREKVLSLSYWSEKEAHEDYRTLVDDHYLPIKSSKFLHEYQSERPRKLKESKSKA